MFVCVFVCVCVCVLIDEVVKLVGFPLLSSTAQKCAYECIQKGETEMRNQ